MVILGQFSKLHRNHEFMISIIIVAKNTWPFTVCIISYAYMFVTVSARKSYLCLINFRNSKLHNFHIALN